MGLLEHQDHHHQQNAMPTAAPTSLNSSASSTPTRHARNADLQAVIGHVRGGGHKGDDDESSSSSSSSSSSDADRRHRRRSSSRRRRRREKETEFAERDLLPPLASIDGVAPTSHPLELSRASFAAAIVPIKPLGCGSYGVVMLVRHVPSGQLLAMKKMSKRRIMDYGHTDHILTEKAILSRIAHPFIIRLVDTFNDDHYVYIFSEFAQGGELFSRVRLGAITEAAAAFYVAEVALALKYLHKQHIVYRDVKPENVVLDAAGHVRLVDFGFAKRIVARSWSICGTIEYLAPEIIRGDGGSFASDWWGVGCMLFELVVGHSPFRAPKTAAVAPAIAVDVTADAPSSDEIKQTERLAVANRILAGRLDYPDSMSSACRDVCAGLLRSAADKRFEFRDLKRHPFFEHIDWTRLVAKQITPPWQPNVDDAEDVRYFNVPREDLLRFLKTQPGPKENDPFAKF
jgi:serine/threonine protein kinase